VGSKDSLVWCISKTVGETTGETEPTDKHTQGGTSSRRGSGSAEEKI